MRSLGAPLPGGVLDEQLARLASLARACGAERAIIVGDLLHARAGLTPELVERVARWREVVGIAIEVVPGNHDRALHRVAHEWGLTVHPEHHREGPFCFTHHPPARGDASAYTWSGHEHPGVRLAGGGDSLRLACYWLRLRVGVLPAFSAFTGRASIRRGAQDAVFAIAGDRVVQAFGADGA